MTILYLDNTTLKAVQTCSTYASLRHILGQSTVEVAAPLEAGTAVHVALAEHFKGASVDACLDAFRRAYAEWAQARVPADHRLSYDNVARILRYWLGQHPPATFPVYVDPTLVEVGAQALLTDEGLCICGHELADQHDDYGCETFCGCPAPTQVAFCGRLDALGRARDNGGWYVVDHKTTGKMDAAWLRKYQSSAQLTGYVWLAQQHVGQTVKGALVNGIQLVDVPGSTNKCKKHSLTYAECGILHSQPDGVPTLSLTERTPEQLAEWRRTALSLARRFVEMQQTVTKIEDIQHVRMEGTFTEACARCEADPWCRMGRTPDLAAAMFIDNPWSPYRPEDGA